MNIEAQLLDIHQAISAARHAVEAQATAVDSVLQYFASCTGSGVPLTEHLNLSAPFSSFETSKRFFPEIYTVAQYLPPSTVIVLDCYEQTSSAQCRNNLYHLLYMKSPRQWCRITLSLQINRSSKYWVATKVSKREREKPFPINLWTAAHIPPSLLIKLQKYLLGLDMLGEDNSIDFSLLNEEPIRTLCQQPFNNTCPRLRSSPNLCQNVLSLLEDMGCEQFVEDQVTQVQMLDPPYRFASCLNGRLVYEEKNFSSIPNPEWIYNIQVLQCMNGVPGFAKLVGIVVDASHRHLKGYLVELPKVHCKLEQATRDRSIPWVRREKWAKQLVQAVSQVHSRSLVVGAFFGSWSPVLIEGSDTIQFWKFKKFFEPTRRTRCYYPPEFLHLYGGASSSTYEDAPASTSKTDLFHLGMLLWLLAANVPLSRVNPACSMEGCNLEGDTCSQKHHAEASNLPDLSEDIPQYYKNMVKDCRAERPGDRPPAKQLLQRFPAIYESRPTPIVYTPADSTLTHSNPRLLGEGLVGMKRCSKCGTTNIQFHFFHCNVCDNADFDLCPDCYVDGLHCDDKEHLLVEFRNDGSSAMNGKYHSSPHAIEGRMILDL